MILKQKRVDFGKFSGNFQKDIVGIEKFGVIKYRYIIF